MNAIRHSVNYGLLITEFIFRRSQAFHSPSKSVLYGYGVSCLPVGCFCMPNEARECESGDKAPRILNIGTT
jgi:hypothetical protein